MADHAPPNHRWFRYSLRTLFGAVTVFAVWLGWESKIVRERRAAIAEIEALNGVAIGPEGITDPAMRRPTIPVWRRWMGDQAVAQLILPFAYTDRAADSNRIVALFPEVVYGQVWWTRPTAHLE